MRRLEKRRIGIWPIAAMIFFVVSGGPYTTEQVVGKSGPLCGLLILAVLPIVWSLPVGLMTAELSSRFPAEGGYFVWVKSAFGPFAGFLCAWWSWTSSWVDLALYPVIAVRYSTRILGDVAHPYPWIVAIIVLFTAWNVFGIGEVGKFSYLVFIALSAPFVVLTGLGLFRWIVHPPSVPFLNPHAQLGGVASAAVLGLWNYFGWDSITSTLGEIEGAGKKLPRAMVLALGMVTAMVVLPVAAGIALKTDWPQWDSENGYWPEIAHAAWPPLALAIVIGGVVSNIAMFNANLLASSRIPFVLAEDRYLPKFLVRMHPRFGTPWAAILVGGGISLLLARESFEMLVSVDLSLYLMALMLECGALVWLRRRSVQDPLNFRVGGGAVGLIACAALPIIIGGGAIVLQLSPSIQLTDPSLHPGFIFLGLVLLGPIFYMVARAVKGRSVARES
jgi:amino acid transporter